MAEPSCKGDAAAANKRWMRFGMYTTSDVMEEGEEERGRE